jgi:hypothetical protein
MTSGLNLRENSLQHMHGLTGERILRQRQLRFPSEKTRMCRYTLRPLSYSRLAL